MTSTTFTKSKKAVLFLGKRPVIPEEAPAMIQAPVSASSKPAWSMPSATASSSIQKEESWENYDDEEEAPKAAAPVKTVEGRSAPTPRVMDKPHEYPSTSSSSSSTQFKATNINNDDDDFLPSASVVNAKRSKDLKNAGLDVADMKLDDFAEGTTANLDVIKNFDDMGISEDVLRGIYAFGVDKPSPIQQRGIPAGLTGKDMISQAHSGTGKTLMFTTITLCMTEKYRNIDSPHPIAMIISPTKILAEQSHGVISEIGKRVTPKLGIECFIGGCSRDDDVRNARRCDIVTGTTGRIVDLYRKGNLVLKHVKLLILDEADELLKENSYNNGNGETFEDHIRAIVEAIPRDAQVIIVSATMTDGTLRMCEKLLNDPIKILLKPETLSLEGIRQYNLYVDPKIQRGSHIDVQAEIFSMKLYVFREIFKSIAAGQTIVFCESIESANMLYEELIQSNWQVGILHGKQEYKERRRAIKDFSSGSTRFLITTDLASRGFDVHSLSLVINFDFPRGEMFKETYLHRIGRSGRHGRKGTAINLIVKGLAPSSHKSKARNFEMGDVAKSHEIQKHFGCQITELPADLSGCL